MSDLIGINSLFGMSDIDVTSFRDEGDKIILIGTPKELKCPVCGSTTQVTKGSTYVRKLKDCPIQGKETELDIIAKRVNCFNMKVHHDKRNNLVPSFAEVEKNSLMTKRLRLQIANEDFAHNTFQQISDKYSISDTVAAKILSEKAQILDTQTAYPECTIIGIDETHLGYTGKSRTPRMCGTIVDMSSEKTKLLDILPDNKSDTIKAALDKFTCPESIKYVTIDMHKGYRDAILECLPGATIIVDRFHVERYLNDAVGKAKKRATEKIRSELELLPDSPEKDAELKRFRDRRENHYWFRRKMSFWNKADLILAAVENGEKVSQKKKDYADYLKKQFDQFLALCDDYPIYSDIVTVHEAFAEVFEAPNRADAEDMFEYAVKLLPPKKDKDNVLAPYWDFVGTVRNWKKYIFNYFDADDVIHRSNGPVEQWNHEIKAAHNDGRGYDYDVLRWKILYGKDKVRLNEQNQFAPIEDKGPYTNLVSNSFKDNSFNLEALRFSPYRSKKIFTMAAAKDSNAARLYESIKAALSNPEDIPAQRNISEFLRSSVPALTAAAEELDDNYRKHHEYIRDGVTVEEVREQAALIHQQIADGLENDSMLVPVLAEDPEDE